MDNYVFGEQTQFLNADLMLRHADDLSDFAKSLTEAGFLLLGVCELEPAEAEGRPWCAKLEIDGESGDENYASILYGIAEQIEKLPEDLRNQWNGLDERIVDLGFEAGSKAGDYSRVIGPDLVARYAALGIGIAITIYTRGQA